MGRTIHSLDARKPLSEALSDVVVGRDAPALALGRTMVVVPAGRLAHALARALVARAAAIGGVLEAPSIVTPLMFAGRFIEPKVATLSRVGAESSWREAIEMAARDEPALLGQLGAAFGSRDGLPRRLWRRASARLARLASEVAVAMRTLDEVGGEVARRVRERRVDPGLAPHWEAIGRLADIRAGILVRAKAADRDDAIREALSDVGRASATPSAQLVVARELVERVVILLADPEPAQRELLRRLEAHGVAVEVCVHAHVDVDLDLDPDGFPIADRWAERRFPQSAIPDAAILVAEGPSDAGSEVVAAIRAMPAPRRSDEIAVLAPDEESLRAIERALGEAGSPAARGGGRTFGATRLGTLLARLEPLVEEWSVDAFAAFIRHPDVVRAIGRKLANGRDGPAPDLHSLERAITRYRARTLVRSLHDKPVEGGDSRREGHDALAYGQLREIVLAWLEPFSEDQALSAWARPIRALLAEIVGDDASGGTDAERVRSIALLDRTLRELHELPKAFSSPHAAHEAISLLRRLLDDGEIRDDRHTDGVTVLGWLDVGVADEPHLVLAGFNDGRVPEGEVVDPLLPEAIRRDLGLASGHRRAARDAWILDGIVTRTRARREAGLPASLRFVVGRRSAEGEPLLPSRLLLAVPPDELSARVRRLFPKEREASPRVEAALESVAFPICPEVEGSRFESISVTSFRTFIACPYLFQLSRDPRLELSALEERAHELDPMAFGNLVHGALEHWGRREAARAAPTLDRATIEAEVMEGLDVLVAASYAPTTAAAVRVQVELARRRLERFARLQAAEAEAGWHVRLVEFQCDRTKVPVLHGDDPADSRGLRLSGRIDRVDQHLETGIWRALDYKTSSDGAAPNATHLVGKKRGSRTWRDLQLPLYSRLLSSHDPSIRVGSGSLGYVNLAASDAKTCFAYLDCTDAEFDGAFEVARKIVGSILRGEFKPAERAPVRAGDRLAPIWGVGLRATSDDDSDSGAGAAGDGEGGGA